MSLLTSFTQELSKDLELSPSLSANDEGAYELIIDDKTRVTISPYKEGFSFFVPFAVCPEVKADQFLTRVMLGNLFGQGTGGAILGLAEDGKQLILLQEFEEIGSYKDFRDHLEDFLNTLEFWSNETNEASQVK